MVLVVEAGVLPCRTRVDLDGHSFHLIPGRSVAVVVTGALVDLERKADELIEGVGAEDHLLGLAKSANNKAVRARVAERLIADRSAVLNANGAHK